MCLARTKGGALNYRKLSLTVLAASALSLGVVQSASAVGQSAGSRAHKTECNKTYSYTTLHGGVVVKSGDVCRLRHVRITGGLTVRGGVFSVQHSLIKGKWLITGGTAQGPTGFGDLCGNNVDGGIRVRDTHGAHLIFGETDRHCVGGRVDGGVWFVNNTAVGILEIDGYRIHGRLLDTHNEGKWNEIEGNIVHGSARCADNNAVHGGATALNDEGGPNHYTGKNTGCPR